MSIILQSSGRQLVWDTICSDTLVPSKLSAAVTEAGVVAVQAETLKNVKYSHPDLTYMFVPVAVEMCGSFVSQTKAFLNKLGHCLRSVTSDENSYQHLFLHRIFVAVQCGNMFLLTRYFSFCFRSGALED